MKYNPKTKQLEGKIEIPETGWADRIMNNIIWGNSWFNPNKDDKHANKPKLRDSGTGR